MSTLCPHCGKAMARNQHGDLMCVFTPDCCVDEGCPHYGTLHGHATYQPTAAELLVLLKRWQGAMRFSGVSASVASAPDNNPVAELIRDTDAMIKAADRSSLNGRGE